MSLMPLLSRSVFLAGVLLGVVSPVPAAAAASLNLGICNAIFEKRPPVPWETVSIGSQRYADLSKSRLYDRVHDLLAKPMSSEWRDYVDAQLREIEQASHKIKWNQLRSFARGELGSGRKFSAKQRADLMKLFEDIQNERQAVSRTARGIGVQDVSSSARQAWRIGDELVADWVARGEPITLEKIKLLNQQLVTQEEVLNIERIREDYNNNLGAERLRNSMLIWNPFYAQGAMRMLENLNPMEPVHPGSYRQSGAFAGAIAEYAFIAAEDIPRAMQDFISWYSSAEGRLHPVELAAQTYRRLVSIHPFSEANGRTSRMVMDWVLQRNGYPPALLENGELNVAAFGRLDEHDTMNPSTGHAISNVAEGVLRTAERLSAIEIAPKSGK